MGVYETFGKLDIQLKITDEWGLKQIGDDVGFSDGVYVGYEGCVVIKNGKFIAEFECLHDKWGSELNCSEIISPNNPLVNTIKAMGNKP